MCWVPLRINPGPLSISIPRAPFRPLRVQRLSQVYSGIQMVLFSPRALPIGASASGCASFCSTHFPVLMNTSPSLFSSASVIRIWDIKQPSNIHNFEGHKGAISAVAFSENGYYLATAAEDATVKLWDLRKLVNLKTIDLSGTSVSKLLFYCCHFSK